MIRRVLAAAAADRRALTRQGGVSETFRFALRTARAHVYTCMPGRANLHGFPGRLRALPSPYRKLHAASARLPARTMKLPYRILVLDDDEHALSGIVELLRDAGTS